MMAARSHTGGEDVDLELTRIAGGQTAPDGTAVSNSANKYRLARVVLVAAVAIICTILWLRGWVGLATFTP